MTTFLHRIKEGIGRWYRNWQTRRRQRKLEELLTIVLDDMESAARHISKWRNFMDHDYSFARGQVEQARACLEAGIASLQRTLHLCRPSFAEVALARFRFVIALMW